LARTTHARTRTISLPTRTRKQRCMSARLCALFIVATLEGPRSALGQLAQRLIAPVGIPVRGSSWVPATGHT